MTDIFSSHAPTGETDIYIVNSNPYAVEGKEIGFPNQFSVYPNKFDSVDGSVLITENRKVSDLRGNRLYLYHKPVIRPDGTATTITSTDGTIDSSNPKQGYIVFSSNPTANFSVSYTAAPDCFSMEYINNLQDDMMEVQKLLGSNVLTGYPSIRNLAVGIFDTPNDSNLTGVFNRSVYLSHLDADLYIGSTTDSSLTGTRGVNHNIAFGGSEDTVTFDVTGFEIKNSNGTLTSEIKLGNRSGDYIRYSGQISGEGPITVGGPSWPNYSGVLGGSLTTTYYNNSMLRVNGDVSVLGDLQAVGSITIVNLTGEISTIIGDFTVTDDFVVHDTSTLIGRTTTNELDANRDITAYANIVAGNSAGAGGNGQTLIDNLDCSEVAHSYNTVIRNYKPNTVLNGRPKLNKHIHGSTLNRWFGQLTGVVESCWAFSGFATANAGPSGVHPNIIQMNFTDDNLPVVFGTSAQVTGTTSGLWSPGFMDPGSVWIKDLNNNFEAPIYGYTIESGNTTSILKLNVFTPEFNANKQVLANDPLLLYNKYSLPYDFISTAGGASPTFQVVASSSYPFEVSFENEVRKMTSNSANISLSTALGASVTGLSTPSTGMAYIFATQASDPENPPAFKARNIPFRQPGETLIGEITASYNGSTWTILDTTSYSPYSIYDSSWIPITATGIMGRNIPLDSSDSLTYFVHNLGTDIDLYRTSVDLYLGTYSSTLPNTWDQAQPLAHSMSTQDRRNQLGFEGAFSKISLTNIHYSGASSSRDASLTYLDGKVIGIAFDEKIADQFPHTSGTPGIDYIRLVIRRDS